MTLLLNYAFRGYGPSGRILTGYCAAAMLFGLWFWLRLTYRGFAMVLQSGAWAIVYISTFAMHVVSGHPVESPITAGLLLGVVTVVIVISALLQHSKSLTAGSFFLAYITAVTNDVSLFTLSALLVVAVGLVLVASYKRWPEFILAGTFATYFVQLGWMLHLGTGLSDVTTTAAGFLILEVLLYGAAHWILLPVTVKERQMNITGTVLNLAGFYWLFHLVVVTANNYHAWIATAFIGLVCAILTGLATIISSRRFLQTTYLVFAVAFVTLALSQWLRGDGLTTAWLIESAAVVIIGVLANHRIMRYLGYAVSVLALGPLIGVLARPSAYFGLTTWSNRLVLGLFGAFIYGLVATVIAIRRSRLTKYELFASRIYGDAAAGLAAVVMGEELRTAWVPVVWAAGGGLAVWAGLQRRNLNARAVGLVLSWLAVIFWLGSVMGSSAMAGSFNLHARVASGLSVVILLALNAWLVKSSAAALSAEERWLSPGFAWSAVLLLTVVLGSEVANRLLSVAWGVEGVLLYIIGFAAQNVHARRQGLVLLALTIAKVYIYDVKTLSAPYQILSFIILGLILLGVGFLYNRWRQRPKLTPPDHGPA